MIRLAFFVSGLLLLAAPGAGAVPIADAVSDGLILDTDDGGCTLMQIVRDQCNPLCPSPPCAPVRID